jgi:hypothetical protein
VKESAKGHVISPESPLNLDCLKVTSAGEWEGYFVTVQKLPLSQQEAPVSLSDWCQQEMAVSYDVNIN